MMLPLLTGLALLVVAASPPPIIAGIPSCEDIHHMLRNGYTVQQLEDMARKAGVSEHDIKQYRKSCHF